MKIVDARTYICDLPAQSVRFDAVQTFTKQETIVVELRAASGIVGRGYAYTIGTGGSAIRHLLEGHVLAAVIGQDTCAVEAAWREMLSRVRSNTVGPLASAALAAVDTALWDVRCREQESSLWAAAGGAQTSLPVYSTETGWLQLSEEELIEGALAARATGFRGVKIKIGKPSAREDIDRVSAVREAIGPEMDLMVDGNQSFDAAGAIRLARAMEDLDVAWFEEPLPADDVLGHALLAKSTSIPIAAGESLYSLGQFRQYLQSGAASIIQVDVARVGGITPWLKVAHLSEAFNVAVAPHFLMELHVSLAAAVPNGRWIEWIPQLNALTRQRLSPSEGFLSPPSTPGIGIDWSYDALRDLCVDDAVAIDPPWRPMTVEQAARVRKEATLGTADPL